MQYMILYVEVQEWQKIQFAGYLMKRPFIDMYGMSVCHTHMKSAEVMKLLKADGWFMFNTRGCHYQVKHPSKSGKVTVPHPKADLPVGTVKSIFKQAGIEWGK